MNDDTDPKDGTEEEEEQGFLEGIIETAMDIKQAADAKEAAAKAEEAARQADKATEAKKK